MNIFINTLGSRGDVEPYVALGQGLRAAGHHVTVCTVARFKPFVTEHGLAYGYMNDEVMALAESEDVREIMGNTTNAWGAVRAMVKLAGRVGPLQRMMLEDSWRAAEAANPDLILFHPKAYGGTHFAEKLGIPAVLAPTLPQFVPTAQSPAIGFPALKLGGWYNRLTYSLTTWLTVMGVGGHTNRWRKANGLSPQRRGTNFISMLNGKPISVLHPISKAVYPVPADWPPYVQATGYWYTDIPADWSPPAALRDFLAAGDPPVYVGFGSMVGLQPRELTEIIITALERAGVRGVLATGWGGIEADDLPSSIFKLDATPHAWLFPQMAAVVHHGGAGTTAAGLRAGKPTIVCPYFGDQPFWGKRIFELGAGPMPIPQKKLSVDGLAGSIRMALTDSGMQRRAVDLMHQLQAEDGVANAVDVVESLL